MPFALPRNIRHLLIHLPKPTESTTVSGWIRSIRKQKNVSFAVITDGSTPDGIQVVLTKLNKDDELTRRLTNGAAVQLTGRLVESPGSGQSHELLVDHNDGGRVQVLGECDPTTYPIQKKSLTAEYLRDHAHLRARTSNIAAMIRLRHTLNHRISDWFQTQGFCSVNTPIITANDAEGAGEAFRLAPLDATHPAAQQDGNTSPETPKPFDFFSAPAYLTVSHQLHLEALATAFTRVYTLSPCFRAEPSLTGRHLAEFWMLEAEWAFPTPDGVLGVCNLTEGLLRETVSDLFSTDDVKLLLKDADDKKRQALADAFSPSATWTRMSYSDAIRELESAAPKAGFVYPPKWGRSLQSEHEKWIAESVVKGPVFVTDYPASLKPFYMRANADNETVACFDLLVPHIGELIGGSVREERADVLQRKMCLAGLIKDAEEDTAYNWYLDLRKYGGAPHAGFGMGFERLISWVSGVDNVRECIPMPRWAGRMLL